MTFRIICYIIGIAFMIWVIIKIITLNNECNKIMKNLVDRDQDLYDKLKEQHIVFRDATPEENEGINNYIKSISERLYTKDDVIERLEKVKDEMHDMLESDVVQGDYWCALIKNRAHLFISVVEKNIDELKGNNNESVN